LASQSAKNVKIEAMGMKRLAPYPQAQLAFAKAMAMQKQKTAEEQAKFQAPYSNKETTTTTKGGVVTTTTGKAGKTPSVEQTEAQFKARQDKERAERLEQDLKDNVLTPEVFNAAHDWEEAEKRRAEREKSGLGSYLNDAQKAFSEDARVRYSTITPRQRGALVDVRILGVGMSVDVIKARGATTEAGQRAVTDQFTPVHGNTAEDIARKVKQAIKWAYDKDAAFNPPTPTPKNPSTPSTKSSSPSPSESDLEKMTPSMINGYRRAVKAAANGDVRAKTILDAARAHFPKQTAAIDAF
jgi:DNA-binding protein YbaB